jgi:hypothetical protein
MLLDEVISPGGEFYDGLSSILCMGATTGKGTSQNMKEASESNDQASRSKKTPLTFHPMYIINLNFSMHDMLMCNIISKVLYFQDLR